MAREEKPLEYERRILDTKGLAQRIDLDYFRRPHRFRDLRRWLTLFLPLGAVLGLAPFFFLSGGKTIFSHGPVSRAHAVFESNCALCHEKAFSKVNDRSCTKCHDAGVHKVNAKGGAPCVDCHLEHQGAFLLAQVPDIYCTRCHSSLTDHGKDVRLSEAALHVTAFRTGRHPRFSSESQTDARPLRLNHLKHLLLKPEDAAKFRLPAAAVAAKGPRHAGAGASLDVASAVLPLKCGNCHEPDRGSPTGEMLPVTFERNCRSCHIRELEFDVNGLLPPGKGVSPHTKDPVTIHKVIQESYQDLLARDPGVTQRTLGRDFVAANAGAWLAAVVQQSEQFLFERKCRYCHEYEDVRGDFPVVKKVNLMQGQYVPEKPEGVPWLPHVKRFSHRVHRPILCSSCHQKATESEKTSDILIPKMQSCLPCHSRTGTPQDRCSECHLYHDKSREADRDRRPVEELLDRPPARPAK